MESLLPSQIALNLFTKPSHSVNIFKYLGHVSSAYWILSRLCKATQESFVSNEAAFLRMLSKEELDFKFYITDLCLFMPVETLRFYNISVRLSDPDHIQLFEKVWHYLLSFEPNENGLVKIPKDHWNNDSQNWSSWVLDLLFKTDMITLELQRAEDLSAGSWVISNLKQRYDNLLKALTASNLNLKTIDIKGDIDDELLLQLLQKKAYLFGYSFDLVTVDNSKLPDILTDKTFILNQSMSSLVQYSSALGKDTTFLQNFYSFYT